MVAACDDSTFTGQAGGYTDGDGTPTAVLAYALQKTDESWAR